MPQPRQSERVSPATKATVAAVAAAAAAQAVPRPPVVEVPAAAARAAAAGSILAALVAFLSVQRSRMRGWLVERLRRRAPHLGPDDVERVLVEEERRQAEFERRQAERFARDLTAALAIPESVQREAAVRGLVGRERRYARQRDEAMAARAFAAVDRVVLRQQSPTGAFWRLDPTVIEHTAGCLVMGGKFWPWPVLERVHPPRHPGCPCRLIGYGEAIAEGLMSPGAVLDVATAIRRAAHVVMEGALVGIDAGDAEALIEAAGGRELMLLRSALIESGLADEGPLDALLERFDPRQARWPKGHPLAGQWRPKIASGPGRAAPGWLERDSADLRALTASRLHGSSVLRAEEPVSAGEVLVFDGDVVTVLDGTPDVHGDVLVRRGEADERVAHGRLGRPIMRTPTSPEELDAIGKKVAAMADRYGTHQAYGERVGVLFDERRAINRAKWERRHAAPDFHKKLRQSILETKRAGTRRPTSELEEELLLTPAERERLRSISGEVADLLVREEEARRDSYAGVLARIRPMGGSPKVRGVHREEAIEGMHALYKASGDERTALDESLRTVQRLVPSAWWEDSNAGEGLEFWLSERRAWHRLESDTKTRELHERALDELLSGRNFEFVGYKGVFPVLRRRDTDKLGWINWGGEWQDIDTPNQVELVRGTEQEPVVPGSRQRWRPRSTIRVRQDEPSTLLHELAHRFELVVGEQGVDGRRPIHRATLRFLRDRAGDGQPRALRTIYPDSGYEQGEAAWEDSFVDAYVGKDYAGRVTEVLTMGMQMLFFPRHGRRLEPYDGRDGDPGMRNLILGIMAAL